MWLDPTDGIAVYTDGSCYHVNRSGGWAWIALDGQGAIQAGSGGCKNTTISQMELCAPERALVTLYEHLGPCTALMCSDSQYVVLGCNDRTRRRNKNLEFWIALDKAINLHEYVYFEHVKGHAKDKYNCMADKLAGAARKGVG